MATTRSTSKSRTKATARPKTAKRAAAKARPRSKAKPAAKAKTSSRQTLSLSRAQVRDIRRARKSGTMVDALAKQYGVSAGTIRAAANKRGAYASI